MYKVKIMLMDKTALKESEKHVIPKIFTVTSRDDDGWFERMAQYNQ